MMKRHRQLTIGLASTALMLGLAACSAGTNGGNVPASSPDTAPDITTPSADPSPAPGDVAGPSPVAPDAGPSTDWLLAHNRHRGERNLPDLVWSEDLMEIAQEWADQLANTQCGSLAHRPGSYLNPRNLGENLSTASASPELPPHGAKFAVDGWAAEVQFYDYDTNECQRGEQCGHYTQVVWRDTRELGCAEAICRDGGWHTKVWTCNYRPAGNVADRRPY